VKTSFDLPDSALRRAKAAAAQQGRPLRDLVAEAIDEKLATLASEITDAPQIRAERRRAWERWKSRLIHQPDGSWLNSVAIDEDAFYQALEAIRREAWPERDPFAGKS
jgi:hypothetical protein